MKVSDIRSTFLEYFEKQQHQIVESGSLVPNNDPTLLFTNAGMVQFKDVFLGEDKRNYLRATTSQRCVRAGGKHNDLENVGYTARHHTFFEMLGNFSFGDYFKKDAIHFAWQLLTKEFKLPAEKLWITVFEEDDEAENIWVNDIGVPKERVIRIGAKDNFWAMGDTGPCGPCSEIFFDHGPEVAGGPPGSPDEDGDRYIEIWNLVFMQYDRSLDGSLKPLPKPCVDTGMGLERMAAVLQHVHSNYDIDLFENLIKAVAKTVHCSDLSNKSLLVIADHIRSTAFLIVDGVLPSNEGRGYVLRRIIRRAIRHGYQVGYQKAFMHKLVTDLVKEMGEAYPQLAEQQSHIEQVLKRENKRFLETLEQGLTLLDKYISELSSDKKIIDGEVIFKLYDTYGFPVDLTNDVAREHGLELDAEGFETLMQSQRDKARSASNFTQSSQISLSDIPQTNFIGYDQFNAKAKVIAMFKDGIKVDSAGQGDELAIVLDQTPFYGESGGQVADIGTLENESVLIKVDNVQKPNGSVFVHYGELLKGEIAVGDKLQANIAESRRKLIANNHSATHLLHAALNEVLGDHVQQKGSLVEDSRLRFDFSHFEPVNDEQMKRIETIVNEEIWANYPVAIESMAIDDAKQKGAQALFGEKYGEIVRVVEMGPKSLELCGGTHVARTGDIGLFKINLETSVASGVRRIEGITAHAALFEIEKQKQLIDTISQSVKASSKNVVEKVSRMAERLKELEKQNMSLQNKLASASLDSWLKQVEVINGVKVLTVKLSQVDNKALRQLLESLNEKIENGIIMLASDNGESVPLLISVAKPLTDKYHAGKLLQQLAPLIGGKGGGKAEMAQGGGSQAKHLDKAFSTLKSLI